MLAHEVRPVGGGCLCAGCWDLRGGRRFLDGASGGGLPLISALRRALELGIKVVDTSELYGRGRAEMLVGIAGAGFDDLFIVTKVQPPRLASDEVAGRLYASRERLKRFPTAVMNHWIPSDICDVVQSLEAALTCARRIEPAVVENRYSLMYR